MSADKYLSIFSRQMEAIVYIQKRKKSECEVRAKIMPVFCFRLVLFIYYYYYYYFLHSEIGKLADGKQVSKWSIT